MAPKNIKFKEDARQKNPKRRTHIIIRSQSHPGPEGAQCRDRLEIRLS